MAGFMAGFAGTLSKSIEDDREYYREAATKRRDYIQTYGTKAVVDREDKANAALGTVNSLIGQGVPEEDVRYVVDTSGIQGLAQLSATLKSRSDLTKADIEGIVKKSKDYVAENPDEDINTVINRAYGLYQSTDKPVQRERNLLSAVLGLDSRMAEDEVMDDLYINGYTGRDIYRIMGSSGPKPGAPLSLNVPAKAPSYQVLAAGAKRLTSQFEASIDGRINSAIRDNDVETRKTLEALKARGVEGIFEYATTYDPALLTYAQRMEQEIPGTITRNSINLGGFTSQFTAGAGDAADDEAMAATQQPGQQQQPGRTPKVEAPSPANKTLTFPDTAAFNKAVASGEVITGDKIQIGDGKVQTFSMPPDNSPNQTTAEDAMGRTPGSVSDAIAKPSVSPAETILKSIQQDGGYEQAAGYDKFYDSVMSLPEEERLKFVEASEALLDTDEINAALGKASDATSGFFDRATGMITGAGSALLAEVHAGFAQALNLFGAKDMAIEELMAAREFRDVAKTMMAQGLTKGIEKQKAGYKDDEGNVVIAENIKKSIENNPALDRVVDILQGNGPGKSEAELREDRIRDDRRQFAADERSFPQPLDTLVYNLPERPEEDPMEARIRDDRRQFAADERSYPQPLDTLVSELPKNLVNSLSEESVRKFVERGGTVTAARDALEKGLRDGLDAGKEQLVAYLKKLKVSDEDIVTVLNAGGAPVKGRDALQGAAEAGVERLTEKLKEFKITDKDVQRVVDAFDGAVTGARDTTEAGLRAAPGSLVKLLRELDLDDTKLREVLEAGGFVVKARDFAEREIRKGLGVNPDRKPTKPTGPYDGMSRDELYDALENNEINLRDLDGAGVKALADRLKQLSN